MKTLEALNVALVINLVFKLIGTSNRERILHNLV